MRIQLIAIRKCECCGYDITVGGTFNKTGVSPSGNVVLTMMSPESLGYFTDGGDFMCPDCNVMLPVGKYFATNR